MDLNVQIGQLNIFFWNFPTNKILTQRKKIEFFHWVILLLSSNNYWLTDFRRRNEAGTVEETRVWVSRLVKLFTISAIFGLQGFQAKE